MTAPGLLPYAPPAGLELLEVAGPEAWRALLAGEAFRASWLDDLDVAWAHAREERFDVPGRCLACDAETAFWSTWDYASGAHRGVRIPNWREFLVCPSCGLNNRQRATLWLTMQCIRSVLERERRVPVVYAMEQVTPFFAWFRTRIPRLPFIGSEYLGPDAVPGEVRGGIRHEDATALSFGRGALDVVVSNDVLEHVFEPERAIAELARVLRPGGRLILSVPINLGADDNVARARLGPGGVEHLLPPAWHGDPISDQGCLVVTDFGWELVRQLREGGFRGAMLRALAGAAYGHRGLPLVFIDAPRDAEDDGAR